MQKFLSIKGKDEVDSSQDIYFSLISVLRWTDRVFTVLHMFISDHFYIAEVW